jgi:hypothetical protein
MRQEKERTEKHKESLSPVELTKRNGGIFLLPTK